MYWDLISVTRLFACSARVCSLPSLVLQPSIPWPVHMQALTLFVFYIIPSTKQKQCAALATKSNSGARLYWKEEMETDQIFEATEEEIVTGSFIQLG